MHEAHQDGHPERALDDRAPDDRALYCFGIEDSTPNRGNINTRVIEVVQKVYPPYLIVYVQRRW